MASFLMLAGCYEGTNQPLNNSVGIGSADETSAGSDESGGDPSAPLSCDVPKPGATPIRRLTSWEYDNTVLDLLGDATRPSRSFPEEGGSGFDNNADVSSVTRLIADKYMLAAEDISYRAVEHVDELLGCAPDAAETACVRTWVSEFGRRAWRRPLETPEVNALFDLFVQARPTTSLQDSIALLLQAMLQSPNFLYRVETNSDDVATEHAVLVGHWEMASRLSYMLWGSMPDEDLFSAAAEGRLQDANDIEAQARRMLQDPRAAAMIHHFHEQWLGYGQLPRLDKDPATFPTWSVSIAEAQLEETNAFVESVFFGPDPSLATLLTAPYTVIDSELASFYGLQSPGDIPAQVESDHYEMSGLLTQGGVLAAHSKPNATNPIARGLFVREQLLCTIPPPPPDGMDIVPPAPEPGATTREIFERHRSDPACQGCHTLFDPIGFGFESYDATGRWRDAEHGLPIDTSGELSATDVAGPFAGAADLGTRLAQSDDVAKCMTRQWFRFAYGRTESQQRDACSLDTLNSAFDNSGRDLRELLVALTQTDAFRYRSVEGGQ